MTRTARRHPHPPLAPVIPLHASGGSASRRRARRRTVPPVRRPVSVWLCTPPAGQPAGLWLATAVTTAVATYTKPGHRVLLLTPPGLTDPMRPADTGPHAMTGPDRDLDRLRQTAGAVTSSGRLVTVRTAQPTPTHHTASSPPTGPRPSPDPDPDRGLTDTAADADNTRVPRESNRLSRPGRPDLVITTVHPDATEWFTGMGWAGLLTPRGLLAAVTHSDARGGRLADPVGAVIRAATRAGLAPLDHVILAHPATPAPAPAPVFSAEDGGASAPVWVHADLLIFANPAGAKGAAQ